MCKVARVSFQLSKGNAGRESPSFALCETESGVIRYSLSCEQWTRVSGTWMSHSRRRIQCLGQQQLLYKTGILLHQTFGCDSEREVTVRRTAAHRSHGRKFGVIKYQSCRAVA